MINLLLISSWLASLAVGDSCTEGFPTFQDFRELAQQCSKTCRTDHGNLGSTFIIPGMNFTCNGTITAWRAAGYRAHNSDNPDTQVPKLQIWRPLSTSIARHYSISSERSLIFCNGDEIGTEGDNVYVCNLDEPMAVQPGDILGFYLSTRSPNHDHFDLYFTNSSPELVQRVYAIPFRITSFDVQNPNTTRIGRQLPLVALDVAALPTTNFPRPTTTGAPLPTSAGASLPTSTSAPPPSTTSTPPPTTSAPPPTTSATPSTTNTPPPTTSAPPPTTSAAPPTTSAAPPTTTSATPPTTSAPPPTTSAPPPTTSAPPPTTSAPPSTTNTPPPTTSAPSPTTSAPPPTTTSATPPTTSATPSTTSAPPPTTSAPPPTTSAPPPTTSAPPPTTSAPPPTTSAPPPTTSAPPPTTSAPPPTTSAPPPTTSATPPTTTSATPPTTTSAPPPTTSAPPSTTNTPPPTSTSAPPPTTNTPPPTTGGLTPTTVSTRFTIATDTSYLATETEPTVSTFTSTASPLTDDSNETSTTTDSATDGSLADTNGILNLPILVVAVIAVILLVVLIVAVLVIFAMYQRGKNKSVSLQMQSIPIELREEGGLTGSSQNDYDDCHYATVRETCMNQCIHRDMEFEVLSNPKYALLYVPSEDQRTTISANRAAATSSKRQQEVLYQNLAKNQFATLSNSAPEFFAEKSEYWQPASNCRDLYQQLYSKRFREIPRHLVRLTEEIGCGQFGRVCKGFWMTAKNVQECAIKTLHGGAVEDDKVKFLQEAAINGQFCHPNVVQLLGVVTVGEPVMIVLEYLENGDLLNFLRQMRPAPGELLPPSTPHQLLKFCQQVAAGMEYLSKKAFVHRDLAARNILVSKDKTCKISDFGMSRNITDDYYISGGGKVPVKWTAPEAIFHKKYSTASDVWSFGAVMYEIWSIGHKPFEDYNNSEVLRIVDSGFCLPPPPGCPRSIYQLMIMCWNPDKTHRPSFHELVQLLGHPEEELLFISDREAECESGALALGSPLQTSFTRYIDLQHTYSSTYVNV